MSNYGNNHIQVRNIPTPIQHTNRREIINFSSAEFTDILNAPSLNLTSQDWDLPDGTTAVFSNYSGSNNYTYTITISNGNVHYLREVSGQEYTHEFFLTDGGSLESYAEFIAPRTLIFRHPTFNYVFFNENVRAYVDDDEFTIEILESGVFKKKFSVK